MAYEWDELRARRARLIRSGSTAAYAAFAISLTIALLLIASPL